MACSALWNVSHPDLRLIFHRERTFLLCTGSWLHDPHISHSRLGLTLEERKNVKCSHIITGGSFLEKKRKKKKINWCCIDYQLVKDTLSLLVPSMICVICTSAEIEKINVHHPRRVKMPFGSMKISLYTYEMNRKITKSIIRTSWFPCRPLLWNCHNVCNIRL